MDTHTHMRTHRELPCAPWCTSQLSGAQHSLMMLNKLLTIEVVHNIGPTCPLPHPSHPHRTTSITSTTDTSGTNHGHIVFKEHHTQCGELHALAEQSQERLHELQKQHLARTDELTRTLTEKHRLEVRCFLYFKAS